MIHETYYNRHLNPPWGTGAKPEGEVIIIMRKPPEMSFPHKWSQALAPSMELLEDWHNRKKNKITWQDYTERFLKEMEHTEAQAEIKRLAEISRTQEIWLVCSCFNNKKECHRFIVLELIRQAGGLVG